jgi:hypothetical protein
MKCDICKKTYREDDWQEVQEFIRIHQVCGFGSVFGDGITLSLNICQHCVKKLLMLVSINEDGDRFIVLMRENKKLKEDNEVLKATIQRCIKTMEGSNCLELDIIFFLKQALKGGE